jgi:hypothetical protein
MMVRSLWLLVVFAIGRLCRMPLVGSPLIFAKLRLTDFADLRNNVGMNSREALETFRAGVASGEIKVQDVARGTGLNDKTLYHIAKEPSRDPRGSIVDRIIEFLERGKHHDAAATDRRGYSTALEVNHKPGDRT